jgi:stage V sporulation protein R
MSLPTELQEMKDRIEGYARGFGLDFFETIFEVVDYQRINEIAAFGGFPTRYPHWRFGMEYEQLSKSAEYGLSKIYEMVINTEPAYAYLLEGNLMSDQKLVMSHVYGHVDFFKNNYYFSVTNRKMVDTMANHSTRVRRLIDRIGLERVERFIDTCLSLDNLIDYQAPYIQRPMSRTEKGSEYPQRTVQVHKLPASGYMDEFINPPHIIEEERRRKLIEMEARHSRFPEDPQYDVLTFLMEFAPLDGWELDLLGIVRAEAQYFAPQGMTKIMNEGWATYWHSRLMTEKALDASEVIDYADACSKVLATSPRQLNPYKLGVELFRDIRERWDRGMFGSEWEHCDSMAERESWNKELGQGMDKIFQVRKLYNDVTFLDEFLTQEFVERQQLYTFGYNPKTRRWEIDSRDFAKVKANILEGLTNFGQPAIAVRDANFRNRSELLLHHKFVNQPLNTDYVQDVLRSLYRVWKRAVFIETLVEDKGRLMGFDGDSYSDEAWDFSAA